MAETLVKCVCGHDMGEGRFKGLPSCDHCDGTICPDFKKVTLSAARCPNCANLIASMREA